VHLFEGICKNPHDAPLAFLPKNIQEMVVINGEVNKAA
jgi:hypothetical protein